MTRLEPMTQARYDSWVDASIRGYAAEKVASGNCPDDGSAGERATKEFAELLPNGLQSERHEIRRMVDDDNDVGHVWFTRETARPGASCSSTTIEVAPAFRRRGHAPDALAAAAQRSAHLPHHAPKQHSGQRDLERATHREKDCSAARRERRSARDSLPEPAAEGGDAVRSH